MEAAVNYNAFLQSLLSSELSRGDDILDFGAGCGTLATPLVAMGRRVVCVEPDSGLRTRLAAMGMETQASIADVDEQFDVIYTFNVLEHIDDDHEAVLALSGRLKPGGKLLVYVPAFPALYSSLDRRVGHFRRYTKDGLVAVVRAAGFQIVRVNYCDSLGFLATLLFKLIGGSSGTINRSGLVAYDRLAFPLSRALDSVAGRWLGKNLYLVARRPRDSVAA
jgi:SAM-dependent methyltransferase